MKTLLSIVGPTASGKTSLSLLVAEQIGAPIVSADSVQVYRGLDIGSGKVGAAAQAKVPHYMIDVAEPCDDFSAGIYGRQVDALLEKLYRERDLALLVGGAGLYLQAVWKGFDDMPPPDMELRESLNAEFKANGLLPLLEELRRVDPASFLAIDRQNPMRVIRALEVYRATGKPISAYRKQDLKADKDYRDLKIGLLWEREALYARINARVDEMLAQGLEMEVKQLWERHGSGCKGLGSVGYREFVEHFEGKHDREEAIRLVKRNSRRYAKRQMTWFRRQQDIQWFPAQNQEAILAYIHQETEGEGR